MLLSLRGFTAAEKRQARRVRFDRSLRLISC